jgi:hypothetical protein
MNKTYINQYGKLFVFIKDNIQIKPLFEPIKSVELTDNIVFKFQSKFFLRMVKKHYVKLLKWPY